MASFRKKISSTGKVSWESIWFIYEKNGTRRQRSKSFGAQADAKAWARKMETEVEVRRISTDRHQTFAVLAETVMTHWVQNNGISISTERSYRNNLALLARELGDIEISKITAKHLSMAQAGLNTNGGAINHSSRNKADAKPNKLARTTIIDIMKTGSMAMELARKWKEIPFNPFHDYDLPKADDKAEIKTMTDEQAMAVFAESVRQHESGKSPGIDVAVAVMYTCGLRVGELLALAMDAIDLKNCKIEIRRTNILNRDRVPTIRERKAKTRAGLRTISFPPELVPLIKRQHAWIKEAMFAWGRTDYATEPLLLFPDLGGRPRNTNTFTVQMRRLQARVGVTGVQPTHVFRHGMASSLLADKVDIKTISSRLGHASVAFTLATYVHAVAGTDDGAAEQIGARFAAIRTGEEQG